MITDFLQTEQGKVINILAADKLMNSPRVYTTFLLWLLDDLFSNLPEVGDMDKPKLVFFFDEAHMLFNVCQAAARRWNRLSPDPLQGVVSTSAHKIRPIYRQSSSDGSAAECSMHSGLYT